VLGKWGLTDDADGLERFTGIVLSAATSAQLTPRLAPGRIGPVGAVIAPRQMEPPLDLAAANELFLAPGVGVQGGTPADVAATFSACP
jgi:orotidine-5'-phosphate decarboxylase